MNICFVYKEDYPWDVRVEKIVKALANHGHQVTLLARNERRSVEREAADGFSIHRLHAWSGPRFLNALSGIPVFFNPRWISNLDRSVGESQSSLIIVRDLPLMPAAIRVARRHGCRVIFDMAECYPEMYQSILEFNSGRLKNWILKNPQLTGVVERYSIRHADHVFVMIEESRDRLLRMGFPSSKISIVSNTPPAEGIAVREHRDSGLLRILYVGFITRIRGLDLLLRGIHAYHERHPTAPRVEFHAIGKGSARREYEALARQLGIEEHATFHGWCDQEFVDRLYAQSDVGALTYRVCHHWNHTIPNKLFDYMRAGMPVLTTNVIPIGRIVNDTGCGVVFPDGDVEACAGALARLADAGTRERLGRNGNRAVRDKYNWERDTDVLLKVVEQTHH